MTNLVNLTPHDINVFTADFQPLFTIPTSGIIARVDSHRTHVGSVNGVDVYTTQFGDVSGLPDYVDNDTMFIVSMLTATAAKQQNHPLADRLLIIDQTVRKDDNGDFNLKTGAIVGCLSFGKI